MDPKQIVDLLSQTVPQITTSLALGPARRAAIGTALQSASEAFTADSFDRAHVGKVLFDLGRAYLENAEAEAQVHRALSEFAHALSLELEAAMRVR